MATTACLQVLELTKTFGGLTALKDVSFEVQEGTITGLIGPNGSGKTVAFDCITGFYKPDHGRTLFQDQDITGLRPNRIALRGVGRSFQITDNNRDEDDRSLSKHILRRKGAIVLVSVVVSDRKRL